MKLKKKIDFKLEKQVMNLGMWGNKFGGNFVGETLKKPIDELKYFLKKMRNNKSLFKREPII